MDAQAILSLISDLYNQVLNLQQENAELKERLNEQAKGKRDMATRDAPTEQYQSKEQ